MFYLLAYFSRSILSQLPFSSISLDPPSLCHPPPISATPPPTAAQRHSATHRRSAPHRRPPPPTAVLPFTCIAVPPSARISRKVLCLGSDFVCFILIPQLFLIRVVPAKSFVGLRAQSPRLLVFATSNTVRNDGEKCAIKSNPFRV
ncbi:hypothetical protein ABFS83_11G124200 [Erythranthe nasuta]